jgi:WD40 repeat protein
VAVQQLTFTPDGTRIAATTNRRTLDIWDVASGNAIQPVTTQRANALGVAFSRNGRLIAIASGQLVGVAENKVILVDTNSRRPLGEFTQTCPIFSLAFSPDSTLVATASGCDGLTLWRADESAWRDIACAAVNRDLSAQEWRDLVGESIPFQSVCPGVR